MIHKKIMAVAGVALFLGVGASVAEGSHSWSGYHWGRTANPFVLALGDNVSSSWDGYLATTASDWSQSGILDATIKPGNTRPRTCKATNGRVEVCNATYGFTGWLGVAQIWVSGGHITKGTVKVNDSYFSFAPYNTPAWKNLVMCQEVGHTLGLNHQDENFTNANLGTCMDYTNNPSTNQHPNQHDYDMLGAIYAHLDSTNTILAAINGGVVRGVGKGEIENMEQDSNLDDPSAWGRVIQKDMKGKNSLYVRELGNKEKVATFVIWVE